MAGIRRLVRAAGLQALGGLAVWILVAVVAWNVADARLDIVTVLLLFAQLVVVPMGLLLTNRGAFGLAAALLSGGRFAFRIGAVAALAALAIPEGELSAAVAALYLLPAAMVGAGCLLRAASPAAVRAAPELASAAAGVFLFAGALFFVFHRQGFTFGGFHELLVQLTAVHFHFIGFGLMAMAGQAARRHARLGGAAVLLLLAGMILTPIGVLAEPGLRAIGALVVVAGLGLTVAATIASLPRLSGAASRLLFVSCAFALFIGAMAGLYAIGEVTGRPFYPLEFMARMHGTLAAVGVVGLGLLGWRLALDR